MNYKLLATQFGESLKYDTTINEIGRSFSALSDLKLKNYPNGSITSSRSQLIYSWVMTVGNSSLVDSDKAEIIRQAIISIVENKDTREKLLLLIDIKPSVKTRVKTYIHESRIEELKSVVNSDFDLTRLCRYCEELNITFSAEGYLSTAMLTRAIIDHVPPIFSKTSFAEVANNYGNKSFKDSMKNLENSSRKISDSHLHSQIRRKEILPNSNQVDFSNDLDVLLAEIVRVLK